MRAALAVRDMGTVVRLFRRWTGASQTAVGALVGMPQPHISELERGSRQIAALDLFERFAEGLGIPRHLLGLASDDMTESGVIVSRRAVMTNLLVATGASLSRNLIAVIDNARQSMDRILIEDIETAAHADDIEEAVLRYGEKAITAPPIEMLCTLVLDFTDIQQLLTQRQPPRVQQRLYRVNAQLATLVADELMVLGQVSQCRAWHSTARTAADQTSDRGLRAHIRTLGAMLPLYYGSVSEALVGTGEAQELLGRATSPTSALAPTLRALAYAQLGDAEKGRAALRQADAAFDKLSEQYQVESVFGFSERRWKFYKSRVLSELRDFKLAEAARQEALALYPNDVIGDPTLIRLNQAACFVSGGDVTQGCQLAQQALLALPPEHRGDIFLSYGTKVLSAVPIERSRNAVVAEYRELLGLSDKGQ
jgi:tetratricopeptide (TPR) repeat protein